MDLPTLYICLFAVLALLTVALGLLRSSEPDLVGTRWMVLSFGCATLGIGLGLLRGRVPDVASIVAGNALIVTAYLLLHRAITEFLGLGARSDRAVGVVMLIGATAGSAYLTYAAPSLAGRIVLISAAIGVQVALSGYRLLREGTRARALVATRFLGSVLVALAVFNLLRARDAATGGEVLRWMNDVGWEAPMALAFLLSAVSTAFGFVWMTSSRLSAQLHHDANTDPLTGLLNRRGFLAAAPARLRAGLDAGRHTLLLFADLDGLKQINDTAGHAAGDRVIADAAEVLRNVLRASDLIARLGGDEFCALVTVNSPGDAHIILDRLERSEAERARRRALHPYTFGISTAITEVDPTDGRSFDELLRQADERMYSVKRSRRTGSGASSS